jgi:hypothetical protein
LRAVDETDPLLEPTMHVYLREEPVNLVMREIDADGIAPDESDLVAIAFFVRGNERPSFRALLPPETVAVLEEATQAPVQLGLLAEEPPEELGEVHAMVGLSVPLGAVEEEEETEPWKNPDPEAWRPDAWKEHEPEPDTPPRTALLAFAPLVRIRRRFPNNFGEELSDLLESALAGDTRPSLEARVDRMLDDL